MLPPSIDPMPTTQGQPAHSEGGAGATEVSAVGTVDGINGGRTIGGTPPGVGAPPALNAGAVANNTGCCAWE